MAQSSHKPVFKVFKMPTQAQALFNPPCRGAPCGYPTHRHASFGKNINDKSATLISIPPSHHSGQPQGIAPTGYVKKLWQRNYYEHIIRDDDDLNRILEYIATNPLKWELDSLHPNKKKLAI